MDGFNVGVADVGVPVSRLDEKDGFNVVGVPVSRDEAFIDGLMVGDLVFEKRIVGGGEGSGFEDVGSAVGTDVFASSSAVSVSSSVEPLSSVSTDVKPLSSVGISAYCSQCGHQPSPKHSSNESVNPLHPPNEDNFSIPSRTAAWQ